jgi:hypothetical protein
LLLLKRSLARNELQQITEICSRLLSKAMGDDNVVIRLIAAELEKTNDVIDAFKRVATTWDDDYRRF